MSDWKNLHGMEAVLSPLLRLLVVRSLDDEHWFCWFTTMTWSSWLHANILQLWLISCKRHWLLGDFHGIKWVDNYSLMTKYVTLDPETVPKAAIETTAPKTLRYVCYVYDHRFGKSMCPISSNSGWCHLNILCAKVFEYLCKRDLKTVLLNRKTNVVGTTNISISGMS